MKKSALLLAVALVVTSAFPAVKSLRSWPWQRSPNTEESSGFSRIARVFKGKTEEAKEAKRAIAKHKSRIDSISKHLKEDLSVQSALHQEQKIHIDIIEGLISGKSRKVVLQQVTPFIKAIYPEDPETFNFRKDAILERLKNAESRFSPSSHLFGRPKAFSSRDLAQTLTATITITSKFRSDDRTPSGQLQKVGLELFTLNLDDKKTTGLQRRTYYKACEELGKSFKNPKNQNSIVRFLWKIDNEEKRHDAKNHVEKNLSEKLKKQLSKIWDQVHRDNLRPSAPKRKRKQKQD